MATAVDLILFVQGFWEILFSPVLFQRKNRNNIKEYYYKLSLRGDSPLSVEFGFLSSNAIVGRV